MVRALVLVALWALFLALVWLWNRPAFRRRHLETEEVDHDPLDLWRAVGSVLGTKLAFLFSWPKSRADFWRRLGVSIVSGFVFSPVLRDYLDWPAESRFVLAAAVLCAVFGWVAIAAGYRIIGKAEKIPPK